MPDINKNKKRAQKPDSGTANQGLMSVGDIGKMCGVPSNTVMHWRQRDSTFPKPVDDPTAGRLYRRSAVVAWLKKTNRIKK